MAARSRRAEELAHCKAQLTTLREAIAEKVRETDQDPSPLTEAYNRKYVTNVGNNNGNASTVSNDSNNNNNSNSNNGNTPEESPASTAADLGGYWSSRLNSIQLNHSRLLSGHFGKVYDLSWGGNINNLVSVSQDGMLIVWDPTSALKRQAVQSDSKWMMCCDMTDDNKYICSGGLDNTCTIHEVDPENGERSSEVCKLTGHDGYLSRCIFIAGSKSSMLTTSGDGSALIWDVDRQIQMGVLSGHSADVLGADVLSDKPNMIVTCSIDLLLKVWDKRTRNGPVASIHGHESDVNNVRWFGDGQRILSASDDASARIFDMRTTKQLQKFVSEGVLDMSAVERSGSGALVFSGHMDGSILAWNTLTGKVVSTYSFEDRISRLRLAPDLSCIASSSWSMAVSIITC